MPWIYIWASPLKSAYVGTTPVKEIYVGTTKVRPEEIDNVYYSDKNYQEYQSLVNSTWSVQFADSWKRFRFYFWVYIWNRTALDFQSNSNVMRIINLDTLTSTSKTLSVTMPNKSFRVWYFWNDRILTPKWILDFQWNVITSFSYDSITPWVPWVVWANSWFDIYKWIVNWDNITFTKIGTSWTDQWSWDMAYWHLWAYLLNSNDTKWSWYSAYVNVSNNSITNFTWWKSSRHPFAVAWPDWKLYRKCIRNNDRWKLQKIWTWSEWFVWDALSTSWNLSWVRFWKFLWNIVSGWMNSNNWTGNWYWSNSYFIGTDWTFSKVQTNAWAYDSEIYWYLWFIDEQWYIYPHTKSWWTWVILKTNKTFTNLNWKNPYLWR